MWWDMGGIRQSNTEELPPNGFDFPDVRRLGPLLSLRALGVGLWDSEQMELDDILIIYGLQ